LTERMMDFFCNRHNQTSSTTKPHIWRQEQRIPSFTDFEITSSDLNQSFRWLIRLNNLCRD
ncbi:MAG: hypothetical protein WBL44_10690, partial [Nitrososphaeraceae archaeon]